MPATLELSTSWGVICVEADGGKIVACDMPKVTEKPRLAFKSGKSRIVASVPRDFKVLQLADKFLRALFPAGSRVFRPLLCPPVRLFCAGPGGP